MLAELDDLEHHLDLANKASAAGLSSGAKAEALELVSRIRNKLDVPDATVVNAFEATHEHRAEGHSSVIGWLKRHCRVRGPEATRRRRSARALRAMPIVHDVQRTGRISREHVDELDHARRAVGDEAFGLAEEALLDAALELRFGDFHRTVRYFVVRAQPSDAGDRERRAEEDQWASSSRTFADVGAVNAVLGPLGFTIWDAELSRLTDELHVEDRAEARDRLGRPPLPSELRRTTRQRRAAAMILMAERSAALADARLGPSPFCLVVHADATLVERLLAAVLDPDAGPESIDLIDLGPDSLHELADGTVVSPQTVLLALLTGAVKGFLHDPDGEILRYGRGRRLFSRPQAEALQARFRRCGHPYGCDQAWSWLQTDHSIEYEDGGSTDVENGIPCCGPHNRWKHNTKHQVPPPGAGPPDTGQRRAPPPGLAA